MPPLLALSTGNGPYQKIFANSGGTTRIPASGRIPIEPEIGDREKTHGRKGGNVDEWMDGRVERPGAYGWVYGQPRGAAWGACVVPKTTTGTVENDQDGA